MPDDPPPTLDYKKPDTRTGGADRVTGGSLLLGVACGLQAALWAFLVVNEIKVDPHTRKWATVALERMLSIKGTGNPIGKQQPVGTTID